MRPVGGQEYSIAAFPCSQATQAATASMSLLPGIEALLAAIICLKVTSPASESSNAFMLCSSKNLPPLARYSCRKENWLPGLPALRKWAAP